MGPERWKRIDELMDALLSIEVRERPAFLEKACAGDDALRGELESLLSAYHIPEGFIDTPPAPAAAQLFTRAGIEHLVGRTLSHYQILSSLGAGGMGEVFLARDTNLRRQIALKILPRHFTCDKSSVARFQREACAASALNHPNILTVYEIGQEDGLHFIATEFVDGQTLRQRIKTGPLALTEAVDTAIQIAGALSAAHMAGIVHRDIKPENIMVRPDGLVKVLDFGIAKLSQPRDSLAEDDALPGAITETSAGVVVGTVQYMS